MSKDIGKIMLSPRGEYRRNTIYYALDIVSFNGSSYIVLNDNTFNTDPTDESKYMLIAAKGDNGEKGSAATISIGSVSTVECGEEAAVENSGTETNAVLNFLIPRGRSAETPTPMIIDVDSYESDGDDEIYNIVFVQQNVSYSSIYEAIFAEGKEFYVRVDNGYLMRLNRYYTIDTTDYLEFSYCEPDYIRYTITFGSDDSIEGTKTFLFR